MVTATTTKFDGELAQVMDLMPYGVYIVGSIDGDGEPNGMMADWVMQVSFKPRQIAVSFENDAHTLANVRASGRFTLNLLPANESGRTEAARFLQPHDGAKVLGRSATQKSVIHHKLDGIPHSVTVDGEPVLNGAIAWLECETNQFVAVGDHTLVTATVIEGKLVRDAEILSSAYTGWTYSG